MPQISDCHNAITLEVVYFLYLVTSRSVIHNGSASEYCYEIWTICNGRLREPDIPASDLVSKLASKYRYSGRTQYQVQLASSMSVSGTLDRSATLDRSVTASLASSRKYTGGSKSLENGLFTAIAVVTSVVSSSSSSSCLRHRSSCSSSSSSSSNRKQEFIILQTVLVVFCCCEKPLYTQSTDVLNVHKITLKG